MHILNILALLDLVVLSFAMVTGVSVVYTSKGDSGRPKSIDLDWLHRLACTGAF